MDQERSTYLTSAMKSAFEEAAVPEKAIDALEDSMTNDPDDRHVLAAAVAGRADTIVTFNLRHFPPDACARFGVEALHPDDFLLALYGATPDEVVATVKQQAADLKSPPWTLEELIGALARAGVERFAETLRPHAL